MDGKQNIKKIRIYVSNTDKYNHEPLYQFLIHTAHRIGMAGATVYKGIMGYGTSSDLVEPSYWEFTEKVPITLEIIDEECKINEYLKAVEPLLEKQPKGCLITVQDVDVVFIKHGNTNKER